MATNPAEGSFSSGDPKADGRMGLTVEFVDVASELMREWMVGTHDVAIDE